MTKAPGKKEKDQPGDNDRIKRGDYKWLEDTFQQNITESSICKQRNLILDILVKGGVIDVQTAEGLKEIEVINATTATKIQAVIDDLEGDTVKVKFANALGNIGKKMTQADGATIRMIRNRLMKIFGIINQRCFEFREDKEYSGQVFNSMDLRGKDLRGVDMSGINLDEVDLSGANLEGADLSNAHMVDCNFTGANLRGIKMKNAFIVGTNFNEVDLENADFEGSTMRIRNLGKAKNAGKAVFKNIEFYQTDFTGGDFAGGDFEGSKIRIEKGSEINFSGANLKNTKFFGEVSFANFTSADMEGADISSLTLKNVDMSSIKFTGLYVRNVFERAEGIKIDTNLLKITSYLAKHHPSCAIPNDYEEIIKLYDEEMRFGSIRIRNRRQLRKVQRILQKLRLKTEFPPDSLAD